MSSSTTQPKSADAAISRKFRVLLIAPSLAITGGQGVQAARLLKEIREAGIDIDFLALDAEIPRVFRTIPYVRTVLNGAYFYSKMLCRAPRYDILHVFSASYWSYTLWSMPPVLLGRLLGKKTIINYRSGEADDHLTNWRSAAPTLRKADVLVAPSTYLVDVFRKFSLPMRSIFNIIDFRKFRYRERRRLRPVFFTNRGLEPLYNVGCVIRAFHLVQQKYSDAELTIAHDGSCRAELGNLVKDLGLRNVRFVGRVSQERMPGFYDDADIYMMSPDLDCMPGTVLECFASGLPLISTNAGGIPYIVEHNRTGLLVNCNDHEAMAECALRLLTDERLVATITRNARRELAKYEGENIRRQWVELYEELAGQL